MRFRSTRITGPEVGERAVRLGKQDAQKPIAVPVRKLSVYLQPFRRSSFLECSLQPKIAKINKTPYFRRSGFFKVIDVDTTKKLITNTTARKHIM